MTYFDHKALWILIAAMVGLPVSIGFVVALLKANKNPFPCHAAKREPVEFGVGGGVESKRYIARRGVRARHGEHAGEAKDGSPKESASNQSVRIRPTHTLTLSSPNSL